MSSKQSFVSGCCGFLSVSNLVMATRPVSSSLINRYGSRWIAVGALCRDPWSPGATVKASLVQGGPGIKVVNSTFVGGLWGNVFLVSRRFLLPLQQQSACNEQEAEGEIFERISVGAGIPFDSLCDCECLSLCSVWSENPALSHIVSRINFSSTLSFELSSSHIRPYITYVCSRYRQQAQDKLASLAALWAFSSLVPNMNTYSNGECAALFASVFHLATSPTDGVDCCVRAEAGPACCLSHSTGTRPAAKGFVSDLHAEAGMASCRAGFDNSLCDDCFSIL